MFSLKYLGRCRLCDGGLKEILHLSSTPPANEFVPEPEKQRLYPLSLLECQECNHIQLSVVVSPEILFRNYVYVSGTSPSFVQHFEDYAETVIERLSLKEGSTVVDVGSNDGTLLRAFKSRGMTVQGIDPATEIARKASDEGLPTVADFLTGTVVDNIVGVLGQFDLVTANNVFAHSDNLLEFASLVRRLLKPSGTFVFEVSYLKDVLDKTLYDSIYHEHLSYHHIKPLLPFFDRLGMTVFDVERVPTHGGSIRVYVSNEWREQSAALKESLTAEDSISSDMKNFSRRIAKIREELLKRIAELKAAGKIIAGFGAPAKLTTLTYDLGLDKDTIDFVVDDSPLKQGLLTPGKHIPVLPTSALYEKKPDYVIIFAWNFADKIIEKHQQFIRDGGHFIVPIPELKEYENAAS